MEAKDIGGVLAGGLIATALLHTLMDKGVLSREDTLGVLRKARTALGTGAMNDNDRVAAGVLDWFIARFPDSLHE
jgi:hypothetical protein